MTRSFHALERQQTPRHEGNRKSVRVYGPRQAHDRSNFVQSHNNPPLRAVSVWRDLLGTGLVFIATCGGLAYFVGWFAAIALFATVIFALAIGLNFVINHTIEL